MEIVKYPTASLLEKSKIVEINQSLCDFIQQMYLTIQSLDWGNPVGLAAPQVGKNIRLFIALGNTYINPELTILPFFGKKICKEGCYSLEKHRHDYEVERFNSVNLKWQDKKGGLHEKVFTGFTAEVIQHEFDHLEGKLCCGNLTKK